MSWLPLNPKRALQLTCRNWLPSTSQTSVPWSSRRSSGCRVSQRTFVMPTFHHSLEICCLAKQLLSEPSRLLLPVLQRPDAHPLLLSETGWVQFSFHTLPAAFYSWALFSFRVASLSQMGKNPEESHGKEFCGSPDRLQLCPPVHRTH